MVKLPDIFTLSRIIIAPVYAVLFFCAGWFGADRLVIGFFLLFLSLIMELSDVLDGYLARRLGQESSWGAVADPLADIVSRLTYFICFAYADMVELWVLLVILYREMGMVILRLTLFNRGRVFGAGFMGKIKTVAYGTTGVWGSVSLLYLAFGDPWSLYGPALKVLRALSYASAGLSIVSFVWYIPGLVRRTGTGAKDNP